jgi:hypothetical protein
LGTKFKKVLRAKYGVIRDFREIKQLVRKWEGKKNMMDGKADRSEG